MELQILMMFLFLAMITTAFIGMQNDKRSDELADKAASELVLVTQAVASRLFELGSQVNTAAGYTSGKPPGSAGSLLYLKDPNNCSIAGIPSLPNDEDGNPVDNSFLPCNFSDTNGFGHSYNITWTQPAYPRGIATIQVGTVPFMVDGKPNHLMAANIARKANKGPAGVGEGILDLIIRYRYNRTTGGLSAVIDRSGTTGTDPYIRRDGTIPFDKDVAINWSGNLVSIKPTGNVLDITGTGGINLKGGDTTIEGNATIQKDVILPSVKVGGTVDARLSRAVFDSRIIQSGDTITKPTCPAGSVPQISLTPVNFPSGNNVVVTDINGSSFSGDIQRVDTYADPATWQSFGIVHIRNNVSTSIVRVHSSQFEMRGNIKCT